MRPLKLLLLGVSGAFEVTREADADGVPLERAATTVDTEDTAATEDTGAGATLRVNSVTVRGDSLSQHLRL